MTDLQVRSVTQVAHFGEIAMDFRKMQLWRSNQLIQLTLQEFKVLKFLVRRPELVMSRQKLIAALWPKKGRLSHRTVDNHISSLRKKIERDPAHPIYLRTVHGVGYKFVP